MKSRACRSSGDPCTVDEARRESRYGFASVNTDDATACGSSTVPVQPQVPSSKMSSVSLITSITLQASKLDLLRNRGNSPSRCIDSWCTVEPVAVKLH